MHCRVRTPLHMMALLAVMLASVTLLAHATPSTESPFTAWKAVAASGSVETHAMSSLQWVDVRRGDMVEAQSLLRTGRRGRTTLTRGGDVLIVDPRTEMVIPSSTVSSVTQNSGTVIYEVDGSTNRDFKVVTPYMVAGVKGTVFMVTVGDRRTSVTVHDGRVEVSDRRNGRRVELEAGDTALMGRTKDDDIEVLRANERHKMDGRDDARKIAARHQQRLVMAVDARRVRDGGAAGEDRHGRSTDYDLNRDRSIDRDRDRDRDDDWDRDRDRDRDELEDQREEEAERQAEPHGDTNPN